MKMIAVMIVALVLVGCESKPEAAKPASTAAPAGAAPAAAPSGSAKTVPAAADTGGW